MIQIYTWAFQEWHTVTEDQLKAKVDVPFGITAEDFKTITGKDYQAPTEND